MIAVTALVANPCVSSVGGKTFEGGTNTLTARSCPAAQSPASPGNKFASPLEISSVGVNRSANVAPIARHNARDLFRATVYALTAAIAD